MWCRQFGAILSKIYPFIFTNKTSELSDILKSNFHALSFLFLFYFILFLLDNARLDKKSTDYQIVINDTFIGQKNIEVTFDNYSSSSIFFLLLDSVPFRFSAFIFKNNTNHEPVSLFKRIYNYLEFN